MPGKPRSEYRLLLDAAMAAESKVQKISLLRHAIRQAYTDNTVLIAIVRKLLPDLKSIDAKVTQATPFRLIIDLTDRPKTKRIKSTVKTKQVGLLDKEIIG